MPRPAAVLAGGRIWYAPLTHAVMITRMRRVLAVVAGAAALCASGCASVPLRDAVPQALVAEAEPEGFGRIRIWGDASEAEVLRFVEPDLATYEAKARALAQKPGPHVANLLALSGGADDGAFGAGVLTGWSKAGTRPQFDLVTGISAGGLLAPLAFLGAEYDAQLASIYTKHDADEIFEATLLAGIFGGASLANSGPLKKLIDQYVDAKLMARVAEERAKGRLLIIGTTNIDAQRPVYWDMGRIGESKDPGALDLFRKVLLASASIPGVFPPVHIKVKAGGKTYEELHVDGGATHQIFLSPGDFSFKSIDKKLNRKIQRRLYNIRNGKLGPEFQETKESTVAVAQRSLSTLTKYQGIGDLVRIYVKSERDGIAFHLVAIPDDFTAPRKEPFDPAYMKALYDRGFKMGEGTIPWLSKPPGL